MLQQMKKLLNLPTKTSLKTNLSIPTETIILVSVGLIVIYPILHLVFQSFNDNGTLNFIAYKEVFTDSHTFKALLNTIVLQVMVLLLTWILGGSLAIIRIKTNYKHKNMIDVFVFLSLVIPPFIFATSMKLFLGNTGFLSRIYSFFNSDYSFYVYSFATAALCLSLHMYPFVYYSVKNRLLLIDENIINSARTFGSGKLHILFKVMIPMLLPAFISTGFLVIARTLANYSVSAELLLPTGIEVLTTRIYGSLSSMALNRTAVLSLFMICLSIIVFLVSLWIEKRNANRKMAVRNNKNTATILLSKIGNHALHTVLVLLFFVITILPFITILFASFFKRWGLKFFIGFGEPLLWNNLTLNNYSILFKEGLIWEPLLHSFIYGGIAAIISSFVASVIVYIHNYKKNTFTNLILGVSQLPISIPNIILAIAAMIAWRSSPFDFYGTSIIIIMTYIVLFTPICIKQIQSVSDNLDMTIFQVARTMGASKWKIYFSIYLKQIRNGLFSGFLMVFLIAFKEIPISLLLYTTNTKTLGVLLFAIQSNNYGLEMTSAVAVIVILISLVINVTLIHIKKGLKKYEQTTYR